MQLNELLDGFPSSSLHRTKCGLVAGELIAMVPTRAQGFEDLGRPVSPFDHESPDRPVTVALRLSHDIPRDAYPGADRLVQSFQSRSGIHNIALGTIF